MTNSNRSSGPRSLRRAACVVLAALTLAGTAVAAGGLWLPIRGVRTFVPTGVQLRTSCDAATATARVEQCEGSLCSPAAEFPCAPYACDTASRTCGAGRCSVNADCAPGYTCNTTTAACVRRTNECADAFTLQTVGGTLVSCAPYKCNAGACREQCDLTSDCTAGYVCGGSFCYIPGDGGPGGTTTVTASRSIGF